MPSFDSSGAKESWLPSEIHDVAREIVDEPENDVHDLDGGVHRVGEAALVVVHRIAEEEEDGLVLADLLDVPRVLQDGPQVAHIGVQVTDDDELPLLGLRELDEPARAAIGGGRPQRRVEGEDFVDRLLQLLE